MSFLLSIPVRAQVSQKPLVNNDEHFVDCYDYYLKGDRRDGLYKVKPIGKENTIEVFCDMRRGGWTVIQRRQDGTTNFYLDWNRYKKGFGGTVHVYFVVTVFKVKQQ